MGNSIKANMPVEGLQLHDIDVLVQVTTIYNESDPILEAQAWNPAKLSLSNKVLTLALECNSGEYYAMPTDDSLEVVSEHLPDRKVGLRQKRERILTFAQIQFATMRSFLLWFLCFNKARRPVWDPESTPNCRVKPTQLCSNKFTWLRRQHHCRNCGQAVCNSCAHHQALLSRLGYSQAQRVCSQCAQKIELAKQPRPKSDKVKKKTKKTVERKVKSQEFAIRQTNPDS